MTIETGIDLAGPDPIHEVIDTGVTVAMTHKEVALDPITDPHTAAHHVTEAQAHATTDETPHTADPHLLAHQPTNGEGCPKRTLLPLHT